MRADGRDRPRDCDFLWLNIVRQAVLGNPLGNIQQFAHPSKVTVGISSLARLAHLIYLFRLPALGSLRLEGLVKASTRPIFDWSDLARPTSLKELSFRKAFVHTSVLVQLLQGCHNLKNLIWTSTAAPSTIAISSGRKTARPPLLTSWPRLSEAPLQFRKLHTIRLYKERMDRAARMQPVPNNHIHSLASWLPLNSWRSPLRPSLISPAATISTSKPPPIKCHGR